MDVPYWAIHEDIERYVKNQYRPEASIVERYIAEEAIEFCTDYLSQVEAIGIPKFLTMEEVLVRVLEVQKL